MSRTIQEPLPALDQISLEILRRSVFKSNDILALTTPDVHGRELQATSLQPAGSASSSDVTAHDTLSIATIVAPYFKILQNSFKALAASHDPEPLGVPFLGHIYDQIRDIIITSKTKHAEGGVPDQWTDDQYSAQATNKQIAGEIFKAMEDVEISHADCSELGQMSLATQSVSLRKDVNRTLVTLASKRDVIAFNRFLGDVPEDSKSWCVPLTLGLSDEVLCALKAKCDAVISFKEVQDLQLRALLRDMKAMKQDFEKDINGPSPAEMDRRYAELYDSFKAHVHSQGAVFPTRPDATSGCCIGLPCVQKSSPPGTVPMEHADVTRPREIPDVISPSATPRSAQQRGDDVIMQGDGEFPSDSPATRLTIDREFELRDY